VKKVIAIVSALVIMLLVISGCSDADKTVELDSSGNPTATTYDIQPFKTPVDAATAELFEILDRWQTVPCYYYETVATTTSENTTLFDSTQKMKVWYKKPIMYTESAVANDSTDEFTMVFISDGTGSMTQWIKGEPVAVKTTGTVEITQEMADFADAYAGKGWGSELMGIRSGNPVILGYEDYSDKKCVIVQYSIAGSSGKAWIWVDNGLPVKMEMTLVSMGMSLKMTTEYFNYDFSDIPDSALKLPDYVTVKTEDLTKGPAALEAILAKAKPVTTLRYHWHTDMNLAGTNNNLSGIDYVKGNNMRSDTLSSVPGVEIWTLYDNDARTMSAHAGGIVSSMGTYGIPMATGSVKFLLAGTLELQGRSETVVGTETIDNFGAVVGTEIIDEIECTILLYEYSGGSMKYWIWNEYGLIIRYEIANTLDADMTDTMVTTYDSFDFSDIPDTIIE
jgi:hypothetical protein